MTKAKVFFCIYTGCLNENLSRMWYPLSRLDSPCQHAVCPRSLVHLYIASRYIKMNKTSWTNGKHRFIFTKGHAILFHGTKICLHKCFPHTCAACSQLPSNIWTMSYLSLKVEMTALSQILKWKFKICRYSM